MLEVGVTAYFSNLFLKSSPLRGGTKRHVTAFSLETIQLLTRLQLLAESKVVKIDIKVYSQIKYLATWVDAIYIAVHCKLLLSYPSLMGVTGICYLLEFFTTAKETEVVIL